MSETAPAAPRRRLKRVLRWVFYRLPSPLQAIVARGYRRYFHLVLQGLGRLRGGTSYHRWVRRYDTLGADDFRAIAEDIGRLAATPLISLVMPVCDMPAIHLRTTIDSVVSQLYPHWELCIADDASTAPQVGRVLADYAAEDRRVRWVGRGERGGVVAAANSALALAGGDFVGFLDAGDRLPPHALYLVAREIDRHPEAGLVYTDEDRLDQSGRRCEPNFKSGWNPDLLLSQNAISRLSVYRTALVRAAGGLRSAFDGAEDRDLALRITQAIPAAAIRHIPHVLYHRLKPAPGAESAGSRHAAEAAQRAVADHLRGRGCAAEVAPAGDRTSLHIRYHLAAEPRISIIVPTRDRVDMLARCVSGILERTEYRNFELCIVDNQSADPDTLAYLERIAGDGRVRVLADDQPFNFSRINNRAAAQADGEILLFLNNDTDIIAPDWLRHMAANAVRPEVGAVGAKLLYPSGRVQHGGVILVRGAVADHFHLNYASDDPGYRGRAAVQQNLSAVTAACLAMRRDVFVEIDGFDENLRVAFNDVDLCLRLRARGYLIVWTPLALLYHHESVTRGSDLAKGRRDESIAESEYMRAQWQTLIDDDPYFNPNLVLTPRSILLATPPGTPYPWRRPPPDAPAADG